MESLLSAVVADGMIGGRHRSNAELVAQGVANIGSALFGGLPATGAIARTATNVRSGGQTPVAGILHALFLLVFMLALAPLMRYVPLSALAAVLLIVAWNMAEIESFRQLMRGPIGDRVVLLLTFGLTATFDLTVAIEVGLVLASFLFMHRMSEVVEMEIACVPHRRGSCRLARTRARSACAAAGRRGSIPDIGTAVLCSRQSSG